MIFLDVFSVLLVFQYSLYLKKIVILTLYDLTIRPQSTISNFFVPQGSHFSCLFVSSYQTKKWCLQILSLGVAL